MMGVFDIFFDSNEKQLKKFHLLISQINEAEKDLQKLSAAELKQASEKLAEKVRQAEGEAQKKLLDEVLPEAYALIRESAQRTIKQRHFDVQLLAGIVLYQGKIAEQRTGEGKTLTATLPLYLNSLTGKGCHLVTPNDYLSRIGCGWMGPVYHLLGISASAIVHDQSFIYDPNFTDEQVQDERLAHLRAISRRQAYEADITYGTNNEFGFDYLRDNMVWDLGQMAQTNALGQEGAHHFAIVDEVDFILIDEARTPLIISAPAEESTEKYHVLTSLVKGLSSGEDYTIEEKNKSAALTEKGIEKIEKWLHVDNLYEKDFQTLHLVEQILKANAKKENGEDMWARDVDYVVKDGEVVIVDEFTGRLMFGRRFSEGFHQAIEAKEGVEIKKESQTLATISFQNYFRMYEKLAGMTGTAETEAEEFHRIYGLEVVVVPTQKPMIRKNQPDLVYKNTEAKFEAAVEEIIEKHQKGQPVLVGTVSIAKNEIMSELLERKGVPHQILNAKHHEKEALILSQAGQIGMVTVATNMAGRGVDIELGGKSPDKDSAEYSDWEREHQQVVALGGLCVLGTERHEARRIDNQLRGRAGRQGDPGISRFYVALDDDLMRLFGGDQIKSLMTALKIPDDIPIENKMVSRSIESAQKRVEGHNFDIRKHLVEYDDVLNKQREIIYRFRRQALEGVAPEKGEIPGETLSQKIQAKIEEQIKTLMSLNSGDGQTDSEKIISDFATIIPFDEKSQLSLKNEIAQLANSTAVEEKLGEIARNIYLMREKEMGEKTIRDVEKFVTLSTVDNLWQAHLDNIDDLREGIGLRGYGQRDPLVEYKNEAFRLFEDLMGEIDDQIVRRIYKVGVPQRQERPAQIALKHQNEEVGPVRAAVVGKEVSGAERAEATRIGRIPVKRGKKIGRNDPCWCGSGKKWKHCHYPERG